jgi:integrating conjugative element relaxase (TIGR03760 family)
MTNRLFQGMKTMIQKGKDAASPPMNPAIFPVLRAEELLASDKRQQILKKLRVLVDLPTAEYEIYYLSAISNFAEFAQSLPATHHSYYSHVGGLLDHALDRTTIALTLCRSYLQPEEGAKKVELSPIQQLWLYAVFTAALFLDAGKMATKQAVTLCDEKGQPLQSWLPYSGPMVSQGDYYKFEFEKQNWARLQAMVGPLLARQLLLTDVVDKNGLPVSGFNWIASNKEILDAWLAMLNEDQTGGGKILTVIPQADAQAIAAYLGTGKNLASTAVPARFTEATGLFSAAAADAAQTPGGVDQQEQSRQHLVQGSIDSMSNVVTGSVASGFITLPMGVAFLNWLKSRVDTGNIRVNQAMSSVHRVSDGVYVSLRAIQDFCRENPQTNAKTVVGELHNLGVTLEGTTQHYFVRNAEFKQFNEGIVIKNAYLILGDANMPTINADFIKVSANVAQPQANAEKIPTMFSAPTPRVK